MTDVAARPAEGAAPPGRTGKGIFLKRNEYLAVIAAAGALLCLGPVVLDAYWLKFLSFLFLSLVIACSWNLIGGYCGYFSFGHGVFFGIGAYAIAVAVLKYNVNFYLSLVIGGLSCAVLAFVMSPMLRLKGFNFALTTLALLEAAQVVFRKWSFTRGLKSWDLGWSFPRQVSDSGFYLLCVACLVLALVSHVLFLASRYGFATVAVKEDELMAKGIGINATLCKVAAFVVSAFWTGVAGAIYGPMITYISTQSIFGLSWSVKPIIVSIFGGMGTLLGPILGGIVLIGVDQMLWERFLEYHTLIYGVLLVVIVMFMPDGLVSYGRKALALLRGKEAAHAG